MNTLGMQRAYMAKNMNAEGIIKVVANALSREFDKNFKLEKINENKFKISLDNYKITMSSEQVERKKSPYGIDKFILESFERQGFRFNRRRSQYIRYCFGDY